MMTIRQIERLWNAKSYNKLSEELLAARPEASFGIEGLNRPCAVAALAVIRMDELTQSHLPLCSTLIRAVLQAQDRDGGWGDPAVTSLCLRALLLGKGDGHAIETGMSFLGNLQKDEGIWPNVPLRRMQEDPAISLFVLYQLGENSRFRSAVRFADAIGWFSHHAETLSSECRNLCKWASLRFRNVTPRDNAIPKLFAA